MFGFLVKNEPMYIKQVCVCVCIYTSFPISQCQVSNINNIATVLCNNIILAMHFFLFLQGL